MTKYLSCKTGQICIKTHTYIIEHPEDICLSRSDLSLVCVSKSELDRDYILIVPTNEECIEILYG